MMKKLRAKFELEQLASKEFKSGLIHGDLCPRNIIWDRGKVYLLDWGTAEINVIPHIEIGIIMSSGEANKEEIETFIEGYGISANEYEQIGREILIFKFLHRLDKYRWAKGNVPHVIDRYIDKVKSAFRDLI